MNAKNEEKAPQQKLGLGHLEEPPNNAVLIAIFIVFNLIIFGVIALLLFTRFELFFYDYQALIGGVLALGAALLTTGFLMWKHAVDQRRDLKNNAEIMRAFCVEWGYRIAEFQRELSDPQNLIIPDTIASQFADNGFAAALQSAGALGGNTICVLLHQRSKVAAIATEYARVHNLFDAISHPKKHNIGAFEQYPLKAEATERLLTLKKGLHSLLMSNVALVGHLGRISQHGQVPEFTNAQLKQFYPKYTFIEGHDDMRPPFFAAIMWAKWDDDDA